VDRARDGAAMDRRELGTGDRSGVCGGARGAAGGVQERVAGGGVGGRSPGFTRPAHPAPFVPSRERTGRLNHTHLSQNKNFSVQGYAKSPNFSAPPI
jgi:hypothetical protein